MVESIQTSNNKDFAVSLVTPWIKGNMYVSPDGFLKIKMQNTILFGMIPAGMTKDSSPLGNVSNVSSNKEFKIGRIFLGLIIAIGGLMALSSSPLVGIVLALIGVGIFGSGIITVFAYERNGVEKRVYLPFFEANHVAEFEEQVLAEIAKFYDDRNVRKHSQENAQTIVDGLRNN
ncbi:DUF2892 domain-containing protein [Leuconostoc rapi]|uniref:DUF2892 domain-containing protein n=1 Tax=Leuconostoc rapi TaxID=1406906 RepID=UPI00195CDEA2|nr:DUF2892 domain-containing protein [Leuconostoc rapi]MBM7435194.1 hypothetical protein [Leuconostoc rapi]